MTRIHFLQHVPFEMPFFLDTLINDGNHAKTTTRFFTEDTLPSISDFDLLIVLGGPMNVYEHDHYPWLVEEKKFIKTAINAQKKVVGICLGAQLIADVLNAKVIKNEHKEIGWFPIYQTHDAENIKLLDNLPNPFFAFHWHGDTFDIPKGATRFAASSACGNQGFIYSNRVIGLQFHLEMTSDGINSLLCNCAADITEGKYIQSEKEILAQSKVLIGHTNEYMKILFSNIIYSDKYKSEDGYGKIP